MLRHPGNAPPRPPQQITTKVLSKVAADGSIPPLNRTLKVFSGERRAVVGGGLIAANDPNAVAESVADQQALPCQPRLDPFNPHPLGARYVAANQADRSFRHAKPIGEKGD